MNWFIWFSSLTDYLKDKVKADNLDNCSVLDENVALVCQEQTEFDEHEGNGFNWKEPVKVKLKVFWKTVLSNVKNKLVHGMM